MKRYLLFAGFSHYPKGGMRDFIEDFDSPDEALFRYNNLYGGSGPKFDWHQIYDTEAREIVDYSDDPDRTW